MSPELKQFFLEIHEWIEQGCPEHSFFDTWDGLCGNLANYVDEFNLSYPPFHELYKLLNSENGSDFPFNKHLYRYRIEQKANTIYKNPHRLAFIKRQVELIKKA